MTIGDRISMLRRSRDLSQEELAEMCGVSRQAVSKWESEQSMPEIDKIITLSEVFSVTTDYILRGIEPLSERPDRKNFPAKPFNIVATAILVIGFIFTIPLTSEMFYNKNDLFSVTLFMFVVICVGLMVFALGSVRISRREQKANAMRFARINVWIIAFVLISIIFNGACCNIIAPVPLPLYGTPYNEGRQPVYTMPAADEQSVERPDGIVDEPKSIFDSRESYYEDNWTDSQRRLFTGIFVITYMLVCTATTVACTVLIERERKGLSAREKKKEEKPEQAKD